IGCFTSGLLPAALTLAASASFAMTWQQLAMTTSVALVVERRVVISVSMTVVVTCNDGGCSSQRRWL
ncbi:MAG: hypothetical protein LBC49_03420, partial [Bacteroidales bacterium]|nr:hypothetical protein [Bacteroidales bacterium]